MVDLNDAVTAMTDVLKRYEDVLPGGLAGRVRSANPATIFHILPEANYTPHFDAYFRKWFAATNVVACGGTESVIGIANSNRSVYASFACPAFVAPAVDPMHRKIYVNADAGVTIGTLYHEFVHFLSHGNFYPEFYALGGRNAIILEGVTEFLTRAVGPEIYRDRASGEKYDTQLFDVVMHSGGGNDKTMDKLAALAFKGDLSPVKELDGLMPRL